MPSPGAPCSLPRFKSCDLSLGEATIKCHFCGSKWLNTGSLMKFNLTDPSSDCFCLKSIYHGPLEALAGRRPHPALLAEPGDPTLGQVLWEVQMLARGTPRAAHPARDGGTKQRINALALACVQGETLVGPGGRDTADRPRMQC